jgi:hypothetical protein
MLSLTATQILYAYEDELGNDTVASLDFWQAANGPAHKQSIESAR